MSMLLVLCIFLISGIVCYLAAKARGLKPVFWGIMGLLFGPLAIPFVFLSGHADKDR
ncbi:MAG: hypothetical protein ABFS39_09980 [Pseudomonadota bacterium]